MSDPDPLRVGDRSSQPIYHIPSEKDIQVEKKLGKDLLSAAGTHSTKEGKYSGEVLREVHVGDLSQGISQLERSENHVAALMTNAEYLGNNPPLALDEWAKKHGAQWVDVIVSKGEAAEKFNQFYNSLLYPIDYPTEKISTFVGPPLGNISGIIDYNHILDDISTDIGYMRLAYVLPANIGTGGILIYRWTIYREIKRQLNLMEKQYRQDPNPELKEKINEVAKWLANQKSVLEEQSVWTSLALFRTVPQLARVGLRIAAGTGVVLEATTSAATGIGLAGASGGLLVITRGAQLWFAHRDERLHRRWISSYKEKSRVVDTTQSEQKLIESREKLQTLLDKRKETHQKKIGKIRPEMEALFQVLKNPEITYENAIDKLHEKGIFLDRLPDDLAVGSKEELLEALDQEEFISNLLDQAVNYQDTLSVLARNGLKSQSLSKQKLQYRFSKFKVYSSAFSLLAAIVSTAITLVLMTLILVGAISMPPFGMAIVGLTFSLLTIAVILTGTLYFFTQKPNLTKEWLKGVNFRLAFYAIPTAFRALQVQLQQFKGLKRAFKAHELSVKIHEIERILHSNEPIQVSRLPKELLPLVKKHKEDQLTPAETESLLNRLKVLSEKLNARLLENEKAKLKIDEKLQHLETKLKYWKKKKEPLEQRLVNAGLKDYLRACNLTKDISGEKINLSKTLVEGLLHDPSLVDEEAAAILTEKMGINFEALRQNIDKGEIKKELIPLLDGFFGSGQNQIIAFIKKQRLNETAKQV